MLKDIFNPVRVTASVGGKDFIFETGRVANQADGAVWVQCGGTVVLVAVCSVELEVDRGFFPLTVEYAERMYAAGRIPGSFFRREIGRPSEHETLVSRLIDRPIRPLFPKGLMQDVQVLATVLSADQENDPTDYVTAFAPYPVNEKGQTNYMSGVTPFSHSGLALNCKDIEASWAFLKWYSTYGVKYLVAAGHQPNWKGTDPADAVKLLFGDEETAAKIIDIDSFKRLQIYITITQIVAMTVYILYPSVQDLRPETFVRDNFFTHLMAFIYAFDTPSGVCPSLHVAYSMGIASVWLKSKDAGKGWKAFVVVSVVLISLSTVVVKQHSVIDVLAAVPTGLVAELLIYGARPEFHKKSRLLAYLEQG